MNRATALLTLAAAAFGGIPAVSIAEQPRTFVINYECDQAEKATDGVLSCSTEGGFSFNWSRDPNDLERDARLRAHYHYNALALRYLQLGGRNFYVTADYWSDGDRRDCTATPSRVGFSCN